MLTYAALTRLERVLRHRTVLSLYINGEVTDNASRAQWRTALRNALDVIETSLVNASHAEREDFLRTRQFALREAERFTPGKDAPGWIGFFTLDAVHYARTVPAPVPTLATWRLGPTISPCIRVLKESRPVLLAVADSTHVRVHRYVWRTLTREGTFDRETKADQPYHMGRPAAPGFSSGTRGRAGTDAAQREHRNATDHMLAEAAQRLQQLAGDDAWIIIGGIENVAAALLARLDKRFAERAAVASIDVHDSDARLAEIARAQASELRAADDLKRVDEALSAQAEGGTGASGLAQADRALLNGQVRELYLTDDFIRQRMDEAESATRRALQEGAVVEHVSGAAAIRLDASGGIAARLRFAVAPAFAE